MPLRPFRLSHFYAVKIYSILFTNKLSFYFDKLKYIKYEIFKNSRITSNFRSSFDPYMMGWLVAQRMPSRKRQVANFVSDIYIYVQNADICISFPMGIATSLTSYPSAASRADPNCGPMQIMPSRNLTDCTLLRKRRYLQRRL